MKVQSLEITNFKSFRKMKVEFGRFNVLIGPNAAGKSNFIQVFRFLRDIVTVGLENAISMQGGVEYIRNLNLGVKEKYLTCKLNIAHYRGLRPLKQVEGEMIGIKPAEFIHEFALEFADDNSGYKVARDSLVQKFDFYKMKNDEIGREENEKVGSGVLKITNFEGKLDVSFIKQGTAPITKEDLIPSLYMDIQSLGDVTRLRESLFIESQFYMPHPESVRKTISELCIYDLDPTQPKSVTSIAGRADLEENGENLAIVLRRILADEEKRRTLFNLTKYVLPFIEDLEVEKFLDKYLQLTVKEHYVPSQYLPASLMSSGSLFIISIIIALYFDKKPLVIFEEPARRVHPHLISKVIEMMKDVSGKKQIILSTHNPEIVKYGGIDNIFFVARDKDGFSMIHKPGEKEDVREFMANEIGIEELYIQNLLS